MATKNKENPWNENGDLVTILKSLSEKYDMDGEDQYWINEIADHIITLYREYLVISATLDTVNKMAIEAIENAS